MTDAAPPRRRRISAGRRAVFVCVWLLFVAGLIWGAMQISVTSQGDALDVWTFYYPSLKSSGALTDDDGADDFDILLLGGSVLEQVAEFVPAEDWGKLAPPGRTTRVYDLTESAHTSRDSLLKMRLLKHRRFDLVVVYHGINDARMNCVPRSEFQPDYTHCAWYASMRKRVAAGQIRFAELLDDAADRLIPLGEPAPDMAAEGRDLKTPAAFAANIRETVQIAIDRCGARVVLVTFAARIPANYTRAAFETGDLSYADGHYKMPAESWGEPAAVRAAIEAHNRSLAEMSDSDSAIVFVDLARAFSERSELFSDPCHFSNAGCAKFFERLKSALVRFPAADEP